MFTIHGHGLNKKIKSECKRWREHFVHHKLTCTQRWLSVTYSEGAQSAAPASPKPGLVNIQPREQISRNVGKECFTWLMAWYHGPSAINWKSVQLSQLSLLCRWHQACVKHSGNSCWRCLCCIWHYTREITKMYTHLEDTHMHTHTLSN